MLTKKNDPKNLKLLLLVGPSMCFEWDKNMLEEEEVAVNTLLGEWIQ